jgi:hypothetical protein
VYYELRMTLFFRFKCKAHQLKFFKHLTNWQRAEQIIHAEQNFVFQRFSFFYCSTFERLVSSWIAHLGTISSLHHPSTPNAEISWKSWNIFIYTTKRWITRYVVRRTSRPVFYSIPGSFQLYPVFFFTSHPSTFL